MSVSECDLGTETEGNKQPERDREREKRGQTPENYLLSTYEMLATY